MRRDAQVLFVTAESPDTKGIGIFKDVLMDLRQAYQGLGFIYLVLCLASDSRLKGRKAGRKGRRECAWSTGV